MSGWDSPRGPSAAGSMSDTIVFITGAALQVEASPGRRVTTVVVLASNLLAMAST